ncbi:eCIS core domain-containing protein [Natrialba chahannaoensis]|uniref:eCIS core domain-containing protein n=1 Tax=Natrialba chahannaoensis TaxID=68911 RepID=UPI00373AEF20
MVSGVIARSSSPSNSSDAPSSRSVTASSHVRWTESPEGQFLLAHELAHVQQQNGGAPISMMPKRALISRSIRVRNSIGKPTRWLPDCSPVKNSDSTVPRAAAPREHTLRSESPSSHRSRTSVRRMDSIGCVRKE